MKDYIDTFRNSWLLRGYGIALALTMIWTFLKWMGGYGTFVAHDQFDPVCWPMLPNCENWYRWLTVDGFKIYLYIYLGLTIATIACFLRKQAVGIALGLLILVHLMKFYIFYSDYRLMGNYHYMEYVVFFAYFLPDRLQVIRLLIVGFYISAGTIKFNYEWLSGAALPEHWIPKGGVSDFMKINGLLPISAAYAVVLEMIIALGLLSRNKWIFWGAFAQFIVFHLFSWELVGFFYPMVMFCILTIYPMERRLWLQGLIKPTKLQPVSIALITVFVLAQIYPKVITGDPALTNEGRILALNMFDAKSDCFSLSVAKFKDHSIELTSRKAGGVRIWCDPYLYFEKARNWCERFKDDPEFERLSLHLISRRNTEDKFRRIVDEQNVCNMDYSIFYNAWIGR